MQSFILEPKPKVTVCFPPFFPCCLFILYFMETQTYGSLSLPKNQTPLCLLRQEAMPLLSPSSLWGGEKQTPKGKQASWQTCRSRVSRYLLTSWSYTQTESGEGRGRGAERGVTTDAPVICTEWVSAGESKAAIETAAAWDTILSHERQQCRRAGWEGWVAKQEEEVRQPYRQQEGRKRSKRKIDSSFLAAYSFGVERRTVEDQWIPNFIDRSA